MHLIVKTWIGHILNINVTPDYTIEQVKSDIHDIYGTDIPTQILRFRDNTLSDFSSIQELQLPCCSQLSLTMENSRSRGIRVLSYLESAPPSSNLLIFDMDDTITSNLILSESIKHFIQKLRTDGYCLAIASFNRSAVEVLRMNGVDKLL